MHHGKRWGIPQRQLWWGIISVLLGLGVLFRVAYLSQPVFWVDEVATAIRVAGYTRPALTQQFATGQPIPVRDLLAVQTLAGDRTWADTFHALIQSPEHAPLYFLLTRAWTQVWGSSITALRSLSVVFSLLALPVMAWVCRELFYPNIDAAKELGESPLVQVPTDPFRQRLAEKAQGHSQAADLAMGLLAVSPFFIAYAQEARPYSLWSLLLLLTQGCLWRSLHSAPKAVKSWFAYGLALSLSLYTSLLTGFVVVGQAIYVGLFRRSHLRPYLLATGGALLAFLPWIWVILTHWQTLNDNTTWMQTAIAPWALLAVWFYSLAVLFFDVPIAANPFGMGMQVGLAIATVSLIGYAAWTLWREPSQRVGRFVVLGALSTPAILLAIDLMRSGQAAATPRYLIPVHLGVLIAVAYLLGDRLQFSPRPRRWRLIMVVLLSVSLLSCLVGLTHTSDYQKARNHANPAIASLINQATTPVLMAEPHLTLDVLSLSRSLRHETTVRMLPDAAFLAEKPPCSEAFVLHPSAELQARLNQEESSGETQSEQQLQLLYRPPLLTPDDVHLSLWKFTPDPAVCVDE